MPLPSHSSSEHIQIRLMPHKKLNAYIALAVYAVAQVVYLLTVAPTFSFWDCGEFIAVANTLGVPHPPGTPIFTMMGRVFIILFSRLSLKTLACASILSAPSQLRLP
jgi:hypothetical protein